MPICHQLRLFYVDTRKYLEGGTTRIVKKIKEMHGCIKSTGKLQLKTKVYTTNQEKTMS